MQYDRLEEAITLGAQMVERNEELERVLRERTEIIQDLEEELANAKRNGGSGSNQSSRRDLHGGVHFGTPQIVKDPTDYSP